MTFGLLGKLEAKLDERTFALEEFVDLPAAPFYRDWTAKLPDDVGMMGNDTDPDCTAAALGHLEQIWTSQSGLILTPTTEEVLEAYRQYGGDDGASMLDALNFARKTGVAGRQIGAFMKLEHRDRDVVKAVIDYFGGVYVGASLPLSAQTLLGWNDLSSPVGSWGGHAMAGGAYDHGEVTFLTWGRRQRASWEWWDRYVDEAYAIVSRDWLEQDGVAPSGLDVEKLTAALEKLAA